MGNLVDFYAQHRRLFIAQKHQNLQQTERFKDLVIFKFLTFCESKSIYHTKGIKNQTAVQFFDTPEMLALSHESRRKYFLAIREFYKRFFKTTLLKKEIL
jgi:hypothetical protein